MAGEESERKYQIALHVFFKKYFMVVLVGVYGVM